MRGGWREEEEGGERERGGGGGGADLTASGRVCEIRCRYSFVPALLRGTEGWKSSPQPAGRGSRGVECSASTPSRAGEILARLGACDYFWRGQERMDSASVQGPAGGGGVVAHNPAADGRCWAGRVGWRGAAHLFGWPRRRRGRRGARHRCAGRCARARLPGGHDSPAAAREGGCGSQEDVRRLEIARPLSVVPAARTPPVLDVVTNGRCDTPPLMGTEPLRYPRLMTLPLRSSRSLTCLQCRCAWSSDALGVPMRSVFPLLKKLAPGKKLFRKKGKIAPDEAKKPADPVKGQPAIDRHRPRHHVRAVAWPSIHLSGWHGDNVEIVANDMGNRTTPSGVTFSNRARPTDRRQRDRGQ